MVRFAVFGILLCAGLRAQVSSGILTGDVHDATGAVVQGAGVTIVNDATGYARSVRTEERGSYQFEDVPPGTYTVSVEKSGFRKTTATNVRIEIDRKLRLDFDLTAGAQHEAVTVTARASLLQTDDATEGYTLDSSTISEVPLDGRNLMSLVTLGPGAIPRQLNGFVHDVINDAQEARGAVALNAPINGARSTMNAYILDGAYNTDRNTYATVIVPPLDSVQEFRIQSSAGSAEYAQSGGGAIDVLTKSGTRTLHGGAFEFLHNDATDARNYFDDPTLPRSVFRQNQYGGSVGGPLPAKLGFFFVSYEGLRGESARSTLHIVPDAAIRTGDFTGRNPIFDPLNLDASGARLPFPGNIIPASRLDPIAQRYLAMFEPLPNHIAADGSNYLDATPSTNANDSVAGRFDRQFGKRGAFFARYNLNQEDSLQAGNFPELPLNEDLRAQQAALGYTYAGTNWLNETRLSFTRLRVFDLPRSAFGADIVRALGITDMPTDPFSYGLPYFVVGDFDTVTDSTFLPQTQRDNTWQLSDGVSLARGRHTWKAGGQWIHFQMNYEQSQYARGRYIFNGQFTSDLANPNTTGDAFADFLLGDASQTQRSVGSAQAYLRQNTYGVYVQDTWRVSTRLTFDYGVRYEYYAPFTEARNRLLNLDYSTLPRDPLLANAPTAGQPDRNNFAPRFGLAWRLPAFFGAAHQAVFRASYGIFYSPEIAVEAYNLVRNNQLNQINESNGTGPELTLENGFPQNALQGLPTYYGLDAKARTPYVQQWSAGVQREIGAGMILEASYIGTKGTKLGRFRTFNTPLQVETGADLPPRPGDLQSLRTFPDLGPIYQVQHIANSSYNSLQIKTEKRMSSRLSVLASFVWSKSIDDADSIIPGLSDSFGAQDERNLRLERGLSSFNVGRRLSAGFVYNFGRLAFSETAIFELGRLRHHHSSGRRAVESGVLLDRLRELGNSKSSQRRSRTERQFAVQPTDRARMVQSQRLLRSGPVHVWRRREEYTAKSGDRGRRRGPSQTFPDP